MDKSGIYSQSGFVFQSKVFALQAARLMPGECIWYEYLDDISKQKSFNDISGRACTEQAAFQVKNKNVTKQDVIQAITIWQMSLRDNPGLKEFHLVLPYGKTVSPWWNDLDFCSYMGELKNASKKKPKSLRAKIYQEITEEELSRQFSIIDANKAIIETEIDHELEEALIVPLHRISNDPELFHNRLNDVQAKILLHIADSMFSCEPYMLSHDAFMELCETTCFQIQHQDDPPSFSTWRAATKRKNYQDLANLREAKQLAHCFQDDSDRIIQHLLYGDYYRDLQFQRMANSALQQIEDLETITYSNFLDVVDELKENGNDEPRRRLRETKRASNDCCRNNFERWGSCIYLTRESETERQISWKD